jgi:hypothetical protein
LAPRRDTPRLAVQQIPEGAGEIETAGFLDEEKLSLGVELQPDGFTVRLDLEVPTPNLKPTRLGAR